MADQVGELDLFLAVGKHRRIVFLLSQSQQSITAYVGHIRWHLPVDITCGG